MSTWNHRVVAFDQSEHNLPTWLAICEVYYDEEGTPHSHTAGGVSVDGESIEELRTTLERMLACLDKPVIEEMK